MLGSGAAAALLPRPVAAAGGAMVTSQIVLAGGRIWVPATIGGQGPFRFIFDTGAVVSGIAEALATKLGLRGLGNRRLNGIGGVADLDFYEAKRVVYGGGILQDSVAFAGLPYPLGGAGLLAAGLVTTRDSDLDFTNSEWRLYPAGRPNFDGLTRLEGFIESGLGGGSDKLVVNGVLDGQTYRLMVDTGSPSELLLFPTEVRRSRLWDDARPFAPTVLRGIGGTTARLGRKARGGRLTIGDFAFDAPLVSLYDPKDFNQAQARYDGVIGLPLIERLDWSTEVRKKRLWVRANGRPEAPEVYSRSGLWLERKGETISVAVVSPASPAAEAGIRAGDVLAPDTDWTAVRRALGGAAGQQATLNVVTPAGTQARILTLRAYL